MNNNYQLKLKNSTHFGDRLITAKKTYNQLECKQKAKGAKLMPKKGHFFQGNFPLRTCKIRGNNISSKNCFYSLVLFGQSYIISSNSGRGLVL